MSVVPRPGPPASLVDNLRLDSYPKYAVRLPCPRVSLDVSGDSAGQVRDEVGRLHQPTRLARREVNRVDDASDLPASVTPCRRSLIVPEVTTIYVLIVDLVGDQERSLTNGLRILIDSFDQMRKDDRMWMIVPVRVPFIQANGIDAADYDGNVVVGDRLERLVVHPDANTDPTRETLPVALARHDVVAMQLSGGRNVIILATGVRNDPVKAPRKAACLPIRHQERGDEVALLGV